MLQPSLSYKENKKPWDGCPRLGWAKIPSSAKDLLFSSCQGRLKAGGQLTPAYADTVWDFSTPTGLLGTAPTATPPISIQPYTGSDGFSVITASGFTAGGFPVALVGQNNGTDDVGLGLNNDPDGENEISAGNFVQLDLRQVQFASLNMSFQASSPFPSHIFQATTSEDRPPSLMPGTRRTPIVRHPGPRITPEAVQLFAEGRRLQKRPRTEKNYYALLDISSQLDHALGLQPWNDCPLLDCGGNAPPKWMTHEPEIADWWRSKQIRRELEQALEAKRET